MATPEISYRCALCGAAIRLGVQSCPNCGETETRPAPSVARALPPPEKPQVSSWLMQPDLEPDAGVTLRVAPEPDEKVLLPPVYLPAPGATLQVAASRPEPAREPAEVPILEIPLAPPQREVEAENVLPALDEEPLALAAAAAVVPDVAQPEMLPDVEDLSAEEKLALIKKATPAVKVLDGPYPRRRKRHRRAGSVTLKDRLAGGLDQLRDVSTGASRKVAPTVDQLRYTSNAVLDRASEDPSARFLVVGTLLVGVAAFVFFVTFFMG